MTYLSLTGNTPAFYFSSEFQLPADWLRIVRPEDDRLEYKIEGDKILTEGSTFRCTYIFKNEIVSTYDSLLVDVLAIKLASVLVMPLMQDLKSLDALNTLYMQKMQQARSADAMEGTPEGIDADFWLESRVSGTNLSDYRWNKYTT